MPKLCIFMEPHFVSLGYLWRRKELLKLFAIGQGKLRGTNRGAAKEDEISKWHSLRFSCIKIYTVSKMTCTITALTL